MTSRQALIVGINRYPSLNSLRLPATDAEAMAQLLEQQGDFRITRLPEVVKDGQLMVGQNAQVSVSQLEDALVKLFKPQHNQIPDVALFYFAGHGVRKQKGLDEGFLATSDTNLNNVWGLNLKWLRQLLQESPIKTQIVWLDCCYSGGLLNFNEADPRDTGSARDRCFIAASRAFEVAYEEVAGNHGVLTQVLLQGLDCTHQEQVTNLELTAFISQHTKTTTQAPVALNLGEAIILTFNRQQEKTASLPTLDKRCPYKGLLYFDCAQEDAQNFFGRERLTDELLAKIRQDNFLAVLGASGSGKSSVVRAGLLYQLQGGRKIAGSETWQQRIITPTDQPLLSLAKAFVDAKASQIERAIQLERALDLLQQKGAKGLHALVLAAETKVVLFLDQFEELFTLCCDDAQRLQFLASLLPALTLLQDKFRLIITLRADFFAKCTEQDYYGLGKLIQQHLVAVTPLTPEELTAAIVKPVERLGVTLEKELVDQLVQDATEATGYLPLLQDVLTQLWQTGLTVKQYTALNGLHGALEKRADQVYQALQPEEQSAAQAIFLSLVQLGEGAQDTRRRAVKTELISQRHNAVLLDKVLLKLADERLVVTTALSQRDAQAVFTITVIDIAHEALIQHWTLLRQWLNENREFKAWLDRLALAKKEWCESGKHDDLLLPMFKALEAKEKLACYGELLHEELIIFIEKSITLRESETAEKERMRQIAEQQKDLALEMINTFTYDVPKALANIPKTAQLTTAILEYNIQSLEKIYALNPEDKSTQRERSVNFVKVGDLYLTLLGNVNKALDYYQRALTIDEQLAEQDPQNSQAQRDLSVCFERLADVYLRLSDTQKALGLHQQALTIREQLAQQDPQNSQVQRDLSVSFEKLADVYLRLGDTQKALGLHQQALTIRGQLAKQDPQNSQVQRDLSMGFEKLADVYLRLGDTQKALGLHQQALTIREQIAGQDPHNSHAQRDLSVSFEKLADVYLRLGDTQKALGLYQQALTISEQLAGQDPQSSQAQHDLSAGFEKLAHVYLQLGDTQKALGFYQQTLTIGEQLAKQDPKNSQAQRDLSVCFKNLAYVYLQLDDTQTALGLYQQALTINEKLAGQDPKNSQAQQKLLVSYWELGTIYEQLKQNQQALQFFNQALPIAEKLAKDKMNQQAQQDLEWMQNAIKAVQK